MASRWNRRRAADRPARDERNLMATGRFSLVSTSAIHLAHAARADGRFNLVRTQAGAGSQQHGVGRRLTDGCAPDVASGDDCKVCQRQLPRHRNGNCMTEPVSFLNPEQIVEGNFCETGRRRRDRLHSSLRAETVTFRHRGLEQTAVICLRAPPTAAVPPAPPRHPSLRRRRLRRGPVQACRARRFRGPAPRGDTLPGPRAAVSSRTTAITSTSTCPRSRRSWCPSRGHRSR